MKTIEDAAVAAVHSVDPDRWQAKFSAVLDRIASRFARYEPLPHAGELMAGMVAGWDRKNCWTVAERRGAVTPDGLQHLLARARWDADEVRDYLRDYVIDAFGDPGAIRATRWFLKRHKRITWAEHFRRFLTARPGNRPQENGIVILDAATVPITRYGWRGTSIPTPWTSTAATSVPA